MGFKIGDKVRIRKDSMYYTIHIGNPRDTNGEITRIGNSTNDLHYIKVLWSNGVSNSYREKDLELYIPNVDLDNYDNWYKEICKHFTNP